MHKIYKQCLNPWHIEYSLRAIQWIPIWHGLDGIQKSLCTCALDESSLSFGRVNPFMLNPLIVKETKSSLTILKAQLGKYLEEKSWSESYQQLSFKYFVKSFSIPKLSNVSKSPSWNLDQWCFFTQLGTKTISQSIWRRVLAQFAWMYILKIFPKIWFCQRDRPFLAATVMNGLTKFWIQCYWI